MQFYIALALSLGACGGYVIGGMITYTKGYDDGWNKALGFKPEDEDRHIGIGA